MADLILQGMMAEGVCGVHVCVCICTKSNKREPNRKNVNLGIQPADRLRVSLWFGSSLVEWKIPYL